MPASTVAPPRRCTSRPGLARRSSRSGSRPDPRRRSLCSEQRYGDSAMAGQASISTEILARYAADAAREVDGVRGLADSPLPRKHAVRVSDENGAVRVELHLVTEWGASIPAIGRLVQEPAREYLRNMADREAAGRQGVRDRGGPPAGTPFSGGTGRMPGA